MGWKVPAGQKFTMGSPPLKIEVTMSNMIWSPIRHPRSVFDPMDEAVAIKISVNGSSLETSGIFKVAPNPRLNIVFHGAAGSRDTTESERIHRVSLNTRVLKEQRDPVAFRLPSVLAPLAIFRGRHAFMQASAFQVGWQKQELQASRNCLKLEASIGHLQSPSGKLQISSAIDEKLEVLGESALAGRLQARPDAAAVFP